MRIVPFGAWKRIWVDSDDEGGSDVVVERRGVENAVRDVFVVLGKEVKAPRWSYSA